MDVSVCITTYNHEKYIKECLESVLNQDFAGTFEIIVCNDNSPDKTGDIIMEVQKNHPKGNLIHYFNNSPNLGYVKNTLFSFKKASGKYIAVLDGDDYFIDPKKLQKQFDFLEANSDFSAVSGDSLVVYEDTNQPSHQFTSHAGKTFSGDELTTPVISQTSTLFFRKEILKDDFPTNILSADRCLYLLAGCYGKLKVLDEILSSYRQFSLSISKNVNYEKMKSDFNIIPFIKKYNPKYSNYSLNRYFYYTLMSYSRVHTKTEFYKAAAGYFYYNMMEKMSESPLKATAHLKWTIIAIRQKYDYKKENASFVK